MKNPFSPKNEFAEVIDTFFNGRPAPGTSEQRAKHEADVIKKIVRMKTCRVRVGDKFYRITAEEVVESTQEKRP